jgi:hypothetical protein
MRETEKYIRGYASLYTVTPDGNVHSHGRLVREKGKPWRTTSPSILIPVRKMNRYMAVTLVDKHGTRKQHAVHRLIAEAFCTNPDNKKYVNHIDGSRDNNVATNLEWVTNQENALHASSIGRLGKQRERIIE